MNGDSGGAENARAARALRLLAGVSVLETVTALAGIVITRWILASPWDHLGGSSGYMHRLETFWAVQRAVNVGTTVAALVATALLWSGLRRRRALAASALAAVAVELALVVFNTLVPAVASGAPPHHYPPVREVMWALSLAIGYGAPLLALLAATPAPRSPGAGRWATIALAVIVAAAYGLKALTLISPLSEKGAEMLQIGWYVVGFGAQIALIIGALSFAHALAPRKVESPRPAVDGSGGGDPGPLRLLGRTIIVRVAVGAPLAIIASVGAARGAPDIATTALVAGTVTGLIVTAMLVMSLAGQRQLPAALCDRESLMIAIVLACLAPVFDIWCALSTGQLLSLVGEAKRASSFWGMPSLSRIEELQTAANWTGRISICLGLAGSFAIVRSLTATARGLVDETLAVRAGRVRALLIYGTGGAVTAWIFATTVEMRGDGALMALVLAAVGLLTIGIVLCVELLRLIFGLANAIERRPPAAEVSPAFPS